MHVMGYLSGAPRVSTQDNASLGAPRAHILGVINGFKSNDWDVRQFIVGDQMPTSWTGDGSEEKFTSSQLKVFLADLVRIYLGYRSGAKAYKNFGQEVSLVYERFAAFQALGMPFKRKGIPWILETQAPLFYEAKSDRKSMVLTGLAKKLEIQAYHECDALVCVTNSLRDIMVEHAGIDEKKILVVPNGVDLEKFDPVKYRPIKNYNEFTIGFVGGLFKWQGIDNLISAVAVLLQKGYELRVVIVGDGTMKLGAQKLAEELGVSDRVDFIGHVAGKDVPQYMASFDVCFSGQTPHGIGVMYGSPMKLYEYMAMGKPVIASAYEDARRLIDDNKDGFLFAAQDNDSLIDSIDRAYQQQPYLSDMGGIARNKIIRDHSWNSRVTKMMEDFSRIRIV